MRITGEGLALIRHHEGCRLAAYRDAAGVWTIGFGHTSMAGPPAVAGGMTISQPEADAILARDVGKFAEGVAAAVRVPLGDQQFSALVSFAYNVGLGNFRTSSVLKAVNAGDFAAVPRRLQLWNRAGGRVLPGLVARRAAEAQLFLKDASAAPDLAATAGPPEMAAGKPALQSTTTLAAAVSALAGIVSTLLGTARQAVDVFGGGSLALLLMLVIVAAALWIIRERRRKSFEDGV